MKYQVLQMRKRAYSLGLLILHLRVLPFVDSTYGNEWPAIPSPPELRFAARVTGRVRQPEFTPEETEQRPLTIEPRGPVQGIQSEAGFPRGCASTATWELEEAGRYTSFLEAFRVESKQLLVLEDVKLEKMREW
ncbi:uncharacterized protein HD556DRAFT_122209 [Suillus plorans]|uniref:Uncharacterized protein n=1 Tax=Suillus plorans TaxID=116603 RepID=A0A9P7DNU3_9AGAM|nr:uncharacterized protein HD556DRAFT_122209 [Suillus plorans]KAG1799326.1 hypothetical protein HD556DRAFT_122209 [Suillus plorans]